MDHVCEICMGLAVVPDACRNRGQALLLFSCAIHRGGESGYDGSPGGHSVQADDERTQVAVPGIRTTIPRVGSSGSAYYGALQYPVYQSVQGGSLYQILCGAESGGDREGDPGGRALV